MRAKQFNPQVLAEFSACVIFGALLIRLTSNGNYLFYVTPRMKPYLWFAAMVMILWALTALASVRCPRHRIRPYHSLVLIFPLLLFLLPHDPTDTGAAAFKSQDRSLGFSAPVSVSRTQGIPSGPADASAQTATAPVSTSVPDQAADPGFGNWFEEIPDLPGLDKEKRTIDIPDDYFVRWINEFYMNMKEYEGYKISLTGFVLKNPETMNDNEFGQVRMMMSCCVADVIPIGLVCTYDKTSELAEKTWFTVEGELFAGQYTVDGNVYDDPEIRVTRITPAEPVQGYVYPY